MTEITSRLSTALADRYAIERGISAGGMSPSLKNTPRILDPV